MFQFPKESLPALAPRIRQFVVCLHPEFVTPGICALLTLLYNIFKQMCHSLFSLHSELSETEVSPCVIPLGSPQTG